VFPAVSSVNRLVSIPSLPTLFDRRHCFWWERRDITESYMVPGKVSLSPCNSGRYEGEMVYGSTHSEPRHYMEMSGQLQASAALTKRNKTRLPFSRSLGGNQSRSGSFGDPAVNRQPLAISSRRIWPLTRKNCKTLFSYKSVYDKITLKIYTDYSSSSTSSGHAVRQ